MGKIRKYLSAELKEGENVLHVIRESSLVIWPRILLGAIYSIILFFFMFPLFAFGIFGIVAFIGLFLLGIWYVGKKFFRWHRNAFIVTTHRIIDVEQKSWLSRNISEISYHKIDNVSHRIRGIFHTIFRCGDLYIQSRGGTTSLMMKNVSRPARIQSFLQQILEEIEEKW
jgi:uncharacterized membrane protein YdbT with pleckstrin-like domain